MNIYFCFVLKQENSSGSHGDCSIKTHDSKRNLLHALSTIKICSTPREGPTVKLLTLQLIPLKPYRRISPNFRLLEECLQTAFQFLTPDVTFYIRSLTCPGQPFVRITRPFQQEGTSASPLVQPPALCRVSYEVWLMP